MTIKKPEQKQNFWRHFWHIPADIWKNLNPKEKEYLKSGLLIIGIIGLLSTIIIPWLLTRKALSFVDYTTTGEIGDTIGGISAPFIGILSAILTFLAFYMQYQANVEQREQFNAELKRQHSENAEQEKTWRIERFENKYYELIRLHKENVNEIQIGHGDWGVANRKAFVSMFYELKYTFYACKAKYDQYLSDGTLTEHYTDARLLRLAYIFFYAGIGPNSDIVTSSMNLNPSSQFNDNFFRRVRSDLFNMREANAYSVYRDEDNNEVHMTSKYGPWGGHQSRLGHYYRHLFQTVKFVVGQDETLIALGVKSDYLRTLRAQLGDFEQLMLYYNALADFGTDWITNGFFTTFKMIHNMPIPLANFGERPEIRFEKELKTQEDLFEWLE